MTAVASQMRPRASEEISGEALPPQESLAQERMAAKTFRTWLNRVAALALPALAGFAWGHDNAQWLPVAAILFPLGWHLAERRWSAFMAAFVYYLCATHGLDDAIVVFFKGSLGAPEAHALWLGAAALNSLTWLLFWSPDRRRRAACAMLNLALTSIPPFGLVGWAHPLSTAGWLFPALGWAALLLWAATQWALLARRLYLLAALALVGVVANIIAKPLPPPPQWTAHDTDFGTTIPLEGLGHGSFTARLTYLHDVARRAAPGERILLTEGLLEVVYPWAQPVLEQIDAELRAKNAVLLLGVDYTGPDWHADNRLLVLGDGKGMHALHQRIPMPVGMWVPWRKTSYQPRWFDSGTGNVGGTRVATAICFEQLLVFTMLTSLWQKPELILGASAMWWATQAPNLITDERQTLAAWSRAFAIPFLYAVNR